MSRKFYRRQDYEFDSYESEGSERESASGQSWLSNATIASYLSDSKIKQTISALKAQITVLEAELLSRRFAGSHPPCANWDDIGDLRGPEDGERLYPRHYRKASKRKSSGTYKKVASLKRTLAKLGVKDVNALLEEWSKIQKGNVNET